MRAQFIPCDLVSLILQATGGALVAVAYKRDQSMQTGKWISENSLTRPSTILASEILILGIVISGLAFQALTMIIFIAVSFEFGRRVRERYRREGRGELPDSPACLAARRYGWGKKFVGALAFSTMCIFGRCVYRVVELQDGWHGPLARNRVLFILLECLLVLLASAAMAALHLVWTFRSADQDEEEGQSMTNPRRWFDTVCACCRGFFVECSGYFKPRRPSSETGISGNSGVAAVHEEKGQNDVAGVVARDGGATDARLPADAASAAGNAGETRYKIHVEPKSGSLNGPHGAHPMRKSITSAVSLSWLSLAVCKLTRGWIKLRPLTDAPMRR